VAPAVLVVPDASEPGDWRRRVAPLREVVRRPWGVERRRPTAWTEDARLVLEHRASEIQQLRRQVAELHAALAVHEARLARIRRLPGYGAARVGLRLLRRVRGTPPTS
jgi:hypothetical protein